MTSFIPAQDARFIVEEMPQFMCEIADEIRAECPGELEHPSLDYAQVNVINIVTKGKVSLGLCLWHDVASVARLVEQPRDKPRV
jgi:hypothetical protein